MDWSKAKSVLIILLLFLNVFLAVNIYFESQANRVTKKTIKNTIKILNDRQVYLECDIPRYNKETGRLSYKHDYKLDTLQIANTLLYESKSKVKNIDIKKPLINNSKTLVFNNANTFEYKNDLTQNSLLDINIFNESEVKAYIEDFASSIGLDVSTFYLDQYIKLNDNRVKFVYFYKYKDFMVFDNLIEAYVTTKGIAHLRYSFREVQDISSPWKIISAYQILLSNKFSKGKIITSIDLGFLEHSWHKDTKELSDNPVWRIKLKSGEDRFFNAYTGKEASFQSK